MLLSANYVPTYITDSFFLFMKTNDLFVFHYLQISFFAKMGAIMPPYSLLLSCCGVMHCPDPEVIVCLCVHKCVDLIYNKAESGFSFFFFFQKYCVY